MAQATAFWDRDTVLLVNAAWDNPSRYPKEHAILADLDIGLIALGHAAETDDTRAAQRTCIGYGEYKKRTGLCVAILYGKGRRVIAIPKNIRTEPTLSAFLGLPKWIPLDTTGRPPQKNLRSYDTGVETYNRSRDGGSTELVQLSMVEDGKKATLGPALSFIGPNAKAEAAEAFQDHRALVCASQLEAAARNGVLPPKAAAAKKPAPFPESRAPPPASAGAGSGGAGVKPKAKQVNIQSFFKAPPVKTTRVEDVEDDIEMAMVHRRIKRSRAIDSDHEDDGQATDAGEAGASAACDTDADGLF